ncbi:RNA-binding protein Hfq [Bacillus cereus]|uniref:RNA chaperone Hfq n=1 Tax=Bacillus cereus TaxID=1396 RepID=UPI000BFA7362|nr:RNA-binding protein Hfq [Bacillus cereus]PGU67915.1 RNA-binding protein Hfq [Bacillus cereus]
MTIQDDLYQQAIEAETEVTIILLKDVRITGKILAVDKFTILILIKNIDKQQLIYTGYINRIHIKNT